MSAAIWQFVVSGITMGAVYALLGLGMTISYNATQTIDVAFGAYAMLGAMVSATLARAGLALPLAVLAAIASVSLLGVIIDRLTVRPAGTRDHITIVLVSLGVYNILESVALNTWGTDPLRLPSFSGEEPIRLGLATVAPQAVWVIGIVALTGLGLAMFFGRTPWGLRMRAYAVSRRAAALVGIDGAVVSRLAFALAGAVGALSGIILSPLVGAFAAIGFVYTMKGLATVVLGGLGSASGAVLGGLTLGLLESLAAGLMPSGYKDLVSSMLLILVLVLMPDGLLKGRKA